MIPRFALVALLIIAGTSIAETGDNLRGNSMFSIASDSFKSNERLNRKFTGEGEDRSPDLKWSNTPSGTREFALICDDPDAPTSEPWVHWVIYRIPGASIS